MLSLLCLSVLLSGQPQNIPPPPPQSWSFIFFSNFRANDDQSIFAQIPKPGIFYRASSDTGSLIAILGGVFNRIEYNRTLKANRFWIVGSDSLLFVAGDRPRENGEDLKSFEFNGYRAGLFTGYGYQFGPRQSLRLKADYHLDFHFYTQSSDASVFTAPSDFFEHGPSLSLEPARTPPSELMEYGVRPLLTVFHRFRHGNSAWGSEGNQVKKDHYSGAAAGITVAIPVRDGLVPVLKGHAAIVSKADRLNAFREGAYRASHLRIMMSDLRVDQTIGGQLGLRWYPSHSRKLSIHPFGHFLAYREVRVGGPHRDSGFGPGLSISGQWRDSTLWNLTYGAMFGNRTDIKVFHEIGLQASVRFWP
jgi:hypothetical protein